MGVIIGLNVDFQNVSDARWKSVYEETLELIDAYPFMDKVVDEETYNETFMYVDRTRERYLSPWHPGKLGWYTIGDMRSFEHAESFILFRDPVFWTEGRGHGETGDVYFSLINWHHDSHPEVARIRTGAVSVFHDKTQGYDYHKYVLGICCLIEDRLKPHAVIDGDVTRAQIQDAVNWVNRHVKKSVALPDRCDYHALATRIRKSLKSEAAQLDALFRLLLYPEGPDLGEFVQAHFKRQTVVKYWKNELRKAKPGTYGMNTALNRYLDMQFRMEALCDILVLDDDERFMDARTFMSSILRTGILKRGNQDSTGSSLDEPAQTLTELFKKTAAEDSDAEGDDETMERYDIENAAG